MPARRTGLSIDASDAVRALQVFPQVLPRRLSEALNDAGRLFVNEMSRSFRPRTSPSDEFLQARTGRLRLSLGKVVTGDSLANLQLQVFSAGVPYANIQEFGGTIKPKPPRKYLTIPLKDNLTAAGVARYPSAADLRTQLGRDFVGPRRGSRDKLHKARTFVLKSRSGKLFIVLKLRTGKLLFLWKLQKQVVIPPRFGMRKTWAAQAPLRKKLFKRAIERSVVEAVGRARGLGSG